MNKKIVHICLYAHYTEEMAYQDNVLAGIHHQDGNTVYVIADCTKYLNGALVDVDVESKEYKNRFNIIRLSLLFQRSIKILRYKIGYAPDLLSVIKRINPDIVMHHGISGLSIFQMAVYKKINKSVVVYADCHSDEMNTGIGGVKKYILHNIWYSAIMTLSKKYIDKIFYINEDVRLFLKQRYKLKDAEIEFLPLGGFIKTSEERNRAKGLIRDRYKIPKTDIVFVHSGKFDRAKKTCELVSIFNGIKCDCITLLLVGEFTHSDEETTQIIKSDFRIRHLGWRSSDELVDILCASDVYLQPGTQSATLQMAICCGLPVVVKNYLSHKALVDGNGYFITDISELSGILKELMDREKVNVMSNRSISIARNTLDYYKIARRLYGEL